MVRNWGWESLLRLYYAVLWVQCCQIELVCFGSVLGLWCSACVHETVPEPAILAQESQARLGEICRDSYRTLLEVIAQAKDFGFGREVISLRRVSLA